MAIREEKTQPLKKWNRGQWEVFIFTNKNCALNYRNQPHFEIPKGEQTFQKLDFERRHCKNIVVSFTTLVRVFFTGTDLGVDICFGSGLDNLKLCFKGWLSFFIKTGSHCLQLAWVVQPVSQLPSEIPDFYGAFWCLNWILPHGTWMIASQYRHPSTKFDSSEGVQLWPLA